VPPIQHASDRRTDVGKLPISGTCRHIVSEVERVLHGLVLGPTNSASVARLRRTNSTFLLSLIDIMSRWWIVERQRQCHHTADFEVKRREYMVEACNKKIIQSRSKGH